MRITPLTVALLATAFLNDNGSATLPDGSTITPDPGVLPQQPTFGEDVLGLGDEDFGDELGDDEIDAIAGQVESAMNANFGAERGSAAGRRVRNRLKRVQRRDRRQHARNQELEQKLREKLGGGSSHARKVQPGVLGASATVVSGTTEYSVTLMTEASFEADELFIDGPANTFVKSISFAESQVMPAGSNEVAISIFGPTAQGRGLVSGKRLNVGQRLVVTFTTSATSGKINVSLIGDKSPTC